MCLRKLQTQPLNATAETKTRQASEQLVNQVNKQNNKNLREIVLFHHVFSSECGCPRNSGRSLLVQFPAADAANQPQTTFKLR